MELCFSTEHSFKEWCGKNKRGWSQKTGIMKGTSLNLGDLKPNETTIGDFTIYALEFLIGPSCQAWLSELSSRVYCGGPYCTAEI